MIDRGLDQFLVRLVFDGRSLEFRCFADDFCQAHEKTEAAYPEARVYAIHLLPESGSDD
jgi:hypothetical protein